MATVDELIQQAEAQSKAPSPAPAETKTASIDDLIKQADEQLKPKTPGLFSRIGEDIKQRVAKIGQQLQLKPGESTGEAFPGHQFPAFTQTMAEVPRRHRSTRQMICIKRICLN